MNYNKIKNQCSLKNISIGSLADKIGMSEAGLYTAFNRNTLKIRDLEKIAEVLGVPASYFFDEEKGISQNGINNMVNSNKNVILNTNKDLEDCRKELELIKRESSLKDKIIEMLERNKD